MSSQSIPQFGTPDRPILLIGAGGMLARAWSQLLQTRGLSFEAVDRQRLDLRRMGDLDELLTRRHAMVINCAGYTDVDGAEAHTETAMQINGHAPGELANRCAQTGSILVHYSTDYVFNGRAGRPYRIDDPIEPLNAYGRSKALGERLIRESGCQHLVVRTSWLYAPWGRNFVRTIARLVEARQEVRVVNDQVGRPTSAEHLAATSLTLAQRGAAGTFHVTDGGQCNWHELAAEVARLRGSTCRVLPCTTAEYPRPAARPAYSVLDLSRTEAVAGEMPPWRANLAAVVSRLECESHAGRGVSS
jgi:dTDP-4-dehydrorhamnose reductase